VSAMPLYALTSSYRRALDDLLGAEDLPAEAIADTIQAMEGEWQQKAEAVTAYCLNLEAEAEAVKKAEQAMRERRDRLERKADWLKSYLMRQMIEMGRNEVKTDQFVARIKKNPPSVAVVDEAAIPEPYWEETFVRRLNKAELLKHLKAGEEVSGVRLIKNQRIDIR
jgi:SpoVK/Ycf46/Vps4 family AAA+-type ATPase